MKKNFFRPNQAFNLPNLRSEENILRSQGLYVPVTKKLLRFVPYAAFALLAILIIVVWMSNVKAEQAIVRDVQRLADMQSAQMAFEALHRETFNYDEAAMMGCNSIGSLVSACNLEQYLPSISELKDPGEFAYKTTVVPAGQEYEVSFVLERSYGSLVAGEHRLNQNGIQ